MIILESGLFAILTILILHSAISDLKTGLVSNISVLLALCVGSVCAVFYYVFFASDCFFAYSVNVFITIIICLTLYAFGIWGAGDSKLLVTTIILFPARIYCLNNKSVASCFLLFINIFVVAFIYVVFDTLIMGIKHKDLFRIPRFKINLKAYVKNFLFLFFLLNISNSIIQVVLSEKMLSDSILLLAIHFVLILVGMRLEEKVNWIVVLIFGLIWLVSIIFGFSNIYFSGRSWITYIVLIALLAFRLIADRYNYKTIDISQLKPGMILSVGSVLVLAQSKMKGLPQSTSEDLNSRLTMEEVDSIFQLSKTKNGPKTITIVRKIPFALFIAIGTIIFALLEVLAT